MQAVVRLDGQEHTIQLTPDQTILNAAREAGLNPPFGCEAGVCAACQARLHEGTVDMADCSALDEDQVEQGLILTCQAVGTCEKVVVEYES